ncbi:hypothetical protein Rhow_003109 [Rhodococcus wratislaviensis]|uniref:Secreted protein n=1 Tax=Rhodococcus wratislaviensis TaxID=44752 RepID=A0A402C7H8_RHOWR|nr:hypothetical protein Rhow_003109 [Rhodococcus wratislaviensis]
MIRSTLATVTAAVTITVLGPALAHADILTSNDSEPHQVTTYDGGSYDSGSGPRGSVTHGILELDGVTHVRAVVAYDGDGNPIWKWVPIGSGPAPAVVFHP